MNTIFPSRTGTGDTPHDRGGNCGSFADDHNLCLVRMERCIVEAAYRMEGALEARCDHSYMTDLQIPPLRSCCTVPCDTDLDRNGFDI